MWLLHTVYRLLYKGLVSASITVRMQQSKLFFCSILPGNYAIENLGCLQKGESSSTLSSCVAELLLSLALWGVQGGRAASTDNK